MGSIPITRFVFAKFEMCIRDRIRSVDFSIFYRDTTFSDPAHDITREFLKKEVLPDVILMPNAGTKAGAIFLLCVMDWQVGLR